MAGELLFLRRNRYSSSWLDAELTWGYSAVSMMLMDCAIRFGHNNWSVPMATPLSIHPGCLTPEQKRDILYNNAARFLQVDRKRR